MVSMMQRAHSCGAFGQHELPVHNADDFVTKQQKMQQQRQLALKRQRDFCKSSIGAGVVASNDTPVESATTSSRTLGWNNFLPEESGSAAAVEKLSLQSPSGLVRIRVPTSEGAHTVLTPTIQAAVSSSSEAFARDGSIVQQPTLERSWSSPSQTKTQQKTRSRSLWRPWASSKRSAPSIECGPQEPCVSLSHDSESSSKRSAPMPSSEGCTETIIEELHVTISPSEAGSVHDRRTALRAGTPWQPVDASGFDEDFGSEISSIPGMSDICGDGAPEDSLGLDDSFAAEKEIIESELIGKDNDEDNDSGTEEKVNHWRAQERQSPAEKRSRFNRLMPSMSSSKFWRASKSEVTRITVTPSAEID